MVLASLRDETTISGESVSSGIDTWFATTIVASSDNLRQDSLSYHMLDILDRSLFLPKMGTNVQWIGTILLSIGNIPLMEQ